MIVGAAGPVKHFMLRYRRAKYAVRGGGREIVWAPPWDERRAYSTGEVVEYGGTFWLSRGRTVSGDTPSAFNSSWSSATTI